VQIQTFLKKIFEQEGFNVEVASNGREGIEKYNAHPADLIISDIIMPKKEGIETIIDLRKSNPDVKIIAISRGSRSTDLYLSTAKHLGAVATFSKPFKITELIDTVKKVLA